MYGYKKYPYRRSYSGYTPVTATFRKGYSRWGSSTNRSLGSAKASKAGTKLDYFNCTVCGNCNFKRAPGEYYSDVIAFYPCVGGVNPTTGIISDSSFGNIYGGLVNDRSFRLRCAQYDEFRIVSMKVKLNIFNSEDGTMTLCSISDRQASRDEVEMDDSVMTDIDSDVPSFREVCESQGSIKTIINKNRITPIVRSVYARDLREKTNYEDCTIEYNPTEGESPLSAITFQVYPDFTPAIYFAIKFSNTLSDSETTFTFGYTVEYNCIFRNPKSDLQTFIIKEDPSYTNGDTRTREDQSKKGITYIPSDDPYIPDIQMKNGKETNISWLNRYIARVALKNAKKVNRKTIEMKSSEPPEAAKPAAEEKSMEVEDDPGTA